MGQVNFSFQGELNHFLSPHKKGVNFTHYFKESPSIKDTIESLGIPHTEVNSIVVNGEAVHFSYIVRDGDRISVYPISCSPEKIPLVPLQPPPPPVPRFILDVHLGKLASSLRMLGFDTLYRNDYEDAEIAEISAKEERIVLTRDRGILMRNLVTYGYYVQETNPEKQVLEVLRRFNLFDAVNPFQRCIRCNGEIEPVEKELVIDRLPPQTKKEIDQFHHCTGCGQIYWQGSHYERMERFVEGILSASPVCF